MLNLAPVSLYIRGGALTPSATDRTRLGQATRREELWEATQKRPGYATPRPVPSRASRSHARLALARPEVDSLGWPLAWRTNANKALDCATRRYLTCDAAALRRAGRSASGDGNGVAIPVALRYFHSAQIEHATRSAGLGTSTRQRVSQPASATAPVRLTSVGAVLHLPPPTPEARGGR